MPSHLDFRLHFDCLGEVAEARVKATAFEKVSALETKNESNIHPALLTPQFLLHHWFDLFTLFCRKSNPDPLALSIAVFN